MGTARYSETASGGQQGLAPAARFSVQLFGRDWALMLDGKWPIFVDQRGKVTAWAWPPARSSEEKLMRAATDRLRGLRWGGTHRLRKGSEIKRAGLTGYAVLLNAEAVK